MSSKKVQKIATRALMYAHFGYLFVLPLLAGAMFWFDQGGLSYSFVLINALVVLLYYGALVRFYRLLAKFWHALVTVFLPIVLVIIANFLQGDITQFFAQAFLLEFGAFLVAVVIVSFVFRPSGWFGAIFPSVFILLYLASWWGVVEGIILHGGVAAAVFFGVAFLYNTFHHGVSIIPAALTRGQELPEWRFGNKLFLGDEEYMQPLVGIKKQEDFLIGFSIAVIAACILIPFLVFSVIVVLEAIF